LGGICSRSPRLYYNGRHPRRNGTEHPGSHRRALENAARVWRAYSSSNECRQRHRNSTGCVMSASASFRKRCMARRHAPVRVLEHTAERMRLREDARIAGSSAYIGSALLCLAIPFLVPSNMAANGARLWTIALFLLPLGLNRLLGTISTFDLPAGTVSVTRTLGRL